jgi:benzoyl-CoA reductase subunit C
MQAVERFKEIYESRHQYAKDWKARTGGKVIGYLCTYTPEELIYAAGILPVRIMGAHEPQDVTEPHIYAMFCPYCRDCLAQGLLGRYDYLDGVMIGQSCLHIRQTFRSWELHIPTDYSYYLYVPHCVQSVGAKPYLAAELAEFKKSLEEWTGKSITNDALDEGIDIVNTNRRLMRQVYELRKAEEPPLTGTEAMQMVCASQVSDKREHNELLNQALEELPQRDIDRETGVRLMTTGSVCDDFPFMEAVESEMGATFVIDEHCTGTRYFWNEVIPQGDRLAAIAARYIDRPPCPQKDWPERTRFPHILKLAKDWNVQGALVIQQKFCDPHELDIPPLREYLEQNGVPSYFLEFEVTVPIGQFSTRVEAFLEMLQLELV